MAALLNIVLWFEYEAEIQIFNGFSPRCPRRQPPLLLRRHYHQMRRRLLRVFWNPAYCLFSQFLEDFERLELGMGID